MLSLHHYQKKISVRGISKVQWKHTQIQKNNVHIKLWDHELVPNTMVNFLQIFCKLYNMFHNIPKILYYYIIFWKILRKFWKIRKIFKYFFIIFIIFFTLEFSGKFLLTCCNLYVLANWSLYCNNFLIGASSIVTCNGSISSPTIKNTQKCPHPT